MIVFPAIDLLDGEAVRLYKGDYKQKTVYSADPVGLAAGFLEAGATHLHVVDLAGARDGSAAAFPLVREIAKESGLKVEIGGGIRDEKTVERYLSAGVWRVILGTAALQNPTLLERLLRIYGDRVAVGVDLREGKVAVRGWLETSEESGDSFLLRLEKLGDKGVICTDSARDGAMRGTNRSLYKDLSEKYRFEVVASGGVSTPEDLIALRSYGIFGAIVGKAIYTGDIDLAKAIEVCK